jgi:hypothetical protein
MTNGKWEFDIQKVPKLQKKCYLENENLYTAYHEDIIIQLPPPIIQGSTKRQILIISVEFSAYDIM